MEHKNRLLSNNTGKISTCNCFWPEFLLLELNLMNKFMMMLICLYSSGFYTHYSIPIKPSISNGWHHMSVGNTAADPASQLGPRNFYSWWYSLSCLEWTIHLLVLCPNSSTGALSSSQVSISIQLYPHLMKSFWFRINISDCCLLVVWSLVTIAAERYLAVCQPFKHNEFTTRKVLLFYGCIHQFHCSSWGEFPSPSAYTKLI